MKKITLFSIFTLCVYFSFCRDFSFDKTKIGKNTINKDISFAKTLQMMLDMNSKIIPYLSSEELLKIKANKANKDEIRAFIKKIGFINSGEFAQYQLTIKKNLDYLRTTYPKEFSSQNNLKKAVLEEFKQGRLKGNIVKNNDENCLSTFLAWTGSCTSVWGGAYLLTEYDDDDEYGDLLFPLWVACIVESWRLFDDCLFS